MSNLLKHIIGIAVVVSAVLSGVSTTVAQSINETLLFTGTLNNTSNAPQSGTFDMVFRFYDAPTGGTLLDTSTHTAANGNPVTVSNGEFAVQLGSGTGNALNGINFNTSTIYVGLTVGTDSEMTPRQRLTAAPYSFNADRLDGYDSTDFLRSPATNTIATTSTDTILTVTQNGAGNILDLYSGATNVLTVTTAGNVGIGTTTPARTLTIDGDLALTGALYDSSNSAGLANYVLRSTGSGVEWVATSTLNMVLSGGDLFTDGGATTYLKALAENLVIGANTLAERTSIDAETAGDILVGQRLVNNITFNTTGTKIYVVGSGDAAINAYDLGVAYDLATVQDNSESLDLGDFDSYPCEVQFNSAMTQMFVLACFEGEIRVYDLSTPGELSTASYNGETYNFITVDDSITAFTFNNDGTKFYLGGYGTDVIYSYDVAVPYDLATAASNGETIDISTPNTALSDITFSPDGSKMYTTASYGSVELFAHDLTVPFDVSTAVYSSETLNFGASFGWALFNPAGDTLYLASNAASFVATFSLDTAYDIASSTYVSAASFAVGAKSNYGLTFNATGSKMYTISLDTSLINTFTLSTPFDPSTAVLSLEGFYIDTLTGERDLAFSDDGLQMFVLESANRRVHEYALTTAFDVSTASYVAQMPTQIGGGFASMKGLTLSASGTRLYVLTQDSFNPILYQYDLTVPYDITTASSTGSFAMNPTGENDSRDIVFTQDGATMYVVGVTRDEVARYDLTTPYDATTATNRTILLDISDVEDGPTSLALSDDGATLFVLGSASDSVMPFTISTGYDRFTVASGTAEIFNGGIAFAGNRLIYASTTNRSVHIGATAGFNATTLGTDNVFMGYEAGFNASSSNHDNLVLLGYQAGRNLDSSASSNTIAIGYQAGYNLGGVENIALSSYAGYQNRGDYNIFGGYRAGYGNTGDYGVIFGVSAGESNVGDQAILFGIRAGEFNQGLNAIAMGSSSGRFNTGDDIIALGYGAAENNTGDYLIAFGEYSGRNNAGTGNTFIGRYTGSENTGSFNDFIGHEAGRYLQSTSSVLLGAYAMSGTAAYQAINNVAIGYGAGANAQTGANNNILIGYRAADNLTTGSNNIVIGYDIDLPSSTQSNTLTISNLIFGTGLTATGTTISSGNIGIATATPTAQLHVAGTLRFSSFGAGTLQTDASGNVSVSSDERLKDIAGAYLTGIDALMGIEPITYQWNEASGFETETSYIGFSAQNVQANIPGAVGEDPHGFLTLSDRGILATVVNAVKGVWETLTISEERLLRTQAELVEVTEEIEYIETLIGEYTTRLNELKAEREGSAVPSSGGDSGFAPEAETSPENSVVPGESGATEEASSNEVSNVVDEQITPDELTTPEAQGEALPTLPESEALVPSEEPEVVASEGEVPTDAGI